MDNVNTNIWNDAQKGEFDWHYKNPWRADDWDFVLNTYKIFNHFGFGRDDFRGKSILDVGAGPRLRTKYFKDSIITALEPLGERFVRNFKWCDLRDVPVYTNPIEEFIPELVHQFDFIISINALDHCYDFNLSISNMCWYLKEGGTIFISYDFHSGSDPLHPLSLSKEVSENTFENNCLKVINEMEYLSYGLGDSSLSYWLTR